MLPRTATLGIGAGQMSRVDASRIAVWKAGEARLSLKGSVVCSDAFFPFPDGLIAAAEAGATAAIQPGGSVRDAEVIAAADERNMAMVFTGVRGISGIESEFAAEDRTGVSRLTLSDAIDKANFGKRDANYQHPDKPFAHSQTALASFTEPELETHRPEPKVNRRCAGDAV